MTPEYLLLPVVLGAMFLGADGKSAGALPSQAPEERCQNDSTAVFAHQGQCQLYYNCSNHALPSRHSPLGRYMQECPYPQLFSTRTSRCEPFADVTCGDRVEHVDCGDYLLYRCQRSRCMPCHVTFPSCKDLVDGVNVYRWREWSPYYVVCLSQRPVGTGYCPRDPTLQMAQLLHPAKRRCVSLYEIPKEHSGYQLNCTHKADGLHLDDVTLRPDVYYLCHCGQFIEVRRCEKGKYFDEWMATCSENPLYNSIMKP